MRALLRIPATYPFAFGLSYSCVKTSFSDLLVQKWIEGREEIDWKRNSTFALFGLCYLGGFQYLLYVKAMGHFFPKAGQFAAQSLAKKFKDVPGIKNLGWQVGLDQFIHHPFVYFPAFYTLREFMTADDPSVGNALGTYRKNMWEDLPALWKIWLPSTIINFAFMPMWARIPWVATTSLLWTIVLSAMRGAGDKEEMALYEPQELGIQKGEKGDHTNSKEKNVVVGHVSGQTMATLARSLRSLRGAPPLDATKDYLMVTVVSGDRVGLLAQLANVIFSAGGNVTTSKMVRFGDTFVAVVLVECVAVSLSDLESALRDIGDKWSSEEAYRSESVTAPTIVLRRVGSSSGGRDLQRERDRRAGSSSSSSSSGGGGSGSTTTRVEHLQGVCVRGAASDRCLQLKLVGRDQPGLVVRVSEILAAHGLNVEQLQTEQFLAEGDANATDLADVQGTMFALEAELRATTASFDQDALALDLEALSKELGAGCVVRITEVDLPF